MTSLSAAAVTSKHNESSFYNIISEAFTSILDNTSLTSIQDCLPYSFYGMGVASGILVVVASPLDDTTLLAG